MSRRASRKGITEKGLRSMNSKRRRKLRFKVLDAYNFRCAICGWCDPTGKLNQTNSRKYLTIDHVVPIVLDGDESFNNLQPLCNDCATEKSKEENRLGQEGRSVRYGRVS